MESARRGLHLCEHNFHNDMRKRVRSEICGSVWLHLTHETDPRQMINDPGHYTRLRKRYSSGIMSTAADRLPHRVNHVRGIDISWHCPSRCYQKSSDVLVKKETERGARCNELRRPIKLLPSSGRPSYYGSNFVVENHFDVVPEQQLDLRDGDYERTDTYGDLRGEYKLLSFRTFVRLSEFPRF